MKKITFFLFISFLFSIHPTLRGQYNYRSPLDIPLVLSANFGELRANHFHTGIDLKTQGGVNKNVYSIEDGYVSRIGVNAGGYGLVLYIDHPNGQTSVYAHLNSFSPKITQFIKEEQYKQECYVIDVSNIAPELLPVKKGEYIAKSGNTGSSGGPHVHFEIRETQSELAIDPLPYYIQEIPDKLAPQIKAIAVYPIKDKAVVNNSTKPHRVSVQTANILEEKITAWGRIGVGIYAIDRMNGTNNIYGVTNVDLYCDEEKIFASHISSVDFETTRMINSFTDFDFWKNNKRFYMKSFIEPGNELKIYPENKNGYIEINEEKDYNLRYELEDIYSNRTSFRFVIQGKKVDIPKPESCSLVMQWDKHNRYADNHFSLTIPPKYLYEDINFILSTQESSQYYSQIYKVHNDYVPLDRYVDMSFRILIDTIIDKKKYGVVCIDNKGKESWIGGTYKDGYITAKIRELGDSYAASVDSVAPEITPVKPEVWVKNKRIVIRLKDDHSGIKNFKGTIDGSFVLFEHDIKSPNYTYKFDDTRLIKGQKHLLKFVATDNAGNNSEYEYSFTY